MASAKNVPSYVQIMIDVLAETRKELIETRKELSEINRRRDAILEENKKLREENSLLKLRVEELLSISKNPVSPTANFLLVLFRIMLTTMTLSSVIPILHAASL